MRSLYYYTARSADGALVRGSIEAATEGAALASLRTRSLFITSLHNAAGARGTLAAALDIRSIPRSEFVALFRSFATLVGAGVPMRRSLEVANGQCSNGRLREALSSIVNDIENGLSLSEAMSRHPKEFPLLFVTMIRAGELGGVLDEVLERLASILERDQAVRKRMASALAYPSIVAIAAIGLIIFLVTSVVPTFRSMYDQMHVPLPWITWALIAAGSWLRHPACWLSIAALFLVLAASVVRARSSMPSALALEALAMRMPLISSLRKKAIVARLARTLGTLLRSGVALISALEVICDIAGSNAYRQSILSLRASLSEGSSISAPLARSGLFDPIFVQMVRVGEETGALDTMLLRIADYYDLDVETALSTLRSMLEPLMILLLGGAVGFVVAAVFIPLYTLIGSIK